MFRLGGIGQQYKIKQKIEELVGVEKANKFYNYWLNNHTTRADIDSLAAWGFNSIRLPMHYRLFTLPVEAEPIEKEPQKIAADPGVVKDITQFYEAWILKRDTKQALRFVSQRSYGCLPVPSEDQKKLTALARIQSGLERPLHEIAPGEHIGDMMSGVQPVNDLVRPVEQENSKAFAIMARFSFAMSESPEEPKSKTRAGFTVLCAPPRSSATTVVSPDARVHRDSMGNIVLDLKVAQ